MLDAAAGGLLPVRGENDRIRLGHFLDRPTEHGEPRPVVVDEKRVQHEDVVGAQGDGGFGDESTTWRWGFQKSGSQRCRDEVMEAGDGPERWESTTAIGDVRDEDDGDGERTGPPRSNRKA